jgi:hypothetical protein
MLKFMASIAEWQSDYISERTKAALKVLRQQGRPIGRAPLGFRIVRTRGMSRYENNEYDRSIMGEIVRLRDTTNPRWNWWQISDYIEATLAQFENREPKQRWQKRQWGRARCWRAYNAELALRAHAAGVKDISTEVVSAVPEGIEQSTS